MSLSNYSTLQSSVGFWLNKSNLALYIPDFILLGEADMFRRIRSRKMETVLTDTISGQTLDLSLAATRYTKIKSLALIVSDEYRALNYIAPSVYFARTGSTSSTDTPIYYTLVGDTVYFGPIPDGTYDYVLWYYQKPESLSAAGTNWVLTNHPDA